MSGMVGDNPERILRKFQEIVESYLQSSNYKTSSESEHCVLASVGRAHQL
jgi:hypothetical protein